MHVLGGDPDIGADTKAYAALVGLLFSARGCGVSKGRDRFPANLMLAYLAMANDLRYRRLERARVAGLAGKFSVAYKGLDELLRQNPDDIEVHRLYGNVLETDAFSQDDIVPADARLKTARYHYRHILRIDSSNLFALFDLAEHFSNIGRNRAAKSLFEEFLRQSKAQNLDEYEYEDELARTKAWLEQQNEDRIVLD